MLQKSHVFKSPRARSGSLRTSRTRGGCISDRPRLHSRDDSSSSPACADRRRWTVPRHPFPETARARRALRTSCCGRYRSVLGGCCCVWPLRSPLCFVWQTILTVARPAKSALPYEVLQHHLTGAPVQPEQARSLFQVKPQTRHFRVGAGNHRDQPRSRGLASCGAIVPSPFADVRSRHPSNKEQNSGRFGSKLPATG